MQISPINNNGLFLANRNKINTLKTNNNLTTNNKINNVNYTSQNVIANFTGFKNCGRDIFLATNHFNFKEIASINKAMNKVVSDNPEKLLRKLVNIGRSPEDDVKPLNADDVQATLVILSGQNDETIDCVVNFLRNYDNPNNKKHDYNQNTFFLSNYCGIYIENPDIYLSTTSDQLLLFPPPNSTLPLPSVDDAK